MRLRLLLIVAMSHCSLIYKPALSADKETGIDKISPFSLPQFSIKQVWLIIKTIYMNVKIFKCLLMLLPVMSFAQNTYPPTGNVGIGTNSPQAALHVNGGQIIETNGTITNTRTLTLKNNGTNQINFGSYDGSWRSSIQIQNNDATKGLFFAPPEGDYNYAILRSINGGMKLDVGGNFSNTGMNALTIDPNGSIGIGTASPGSKLHVEGDQLINGRLYLGSADNSMGYGRAIDFGQFSNSDPISMARYNISGDQSALRLVLGDDGNDRFEIGYHSWQNGNWISAVSITSSGQMAVGTTAIPNGYKLAVGGNIIAEKVRVQLQPWADYVFEPSYKLPSLKEVEQYIKQYRHLPEVPSAKEVEANGIDLGDNQATLLKKIEELTLYMIEIKKENDTLKQRIEKLENKK